MLIAVASGGAVGAVCRYLVGIAATKTLGADFPYGTLIVNVLGSFAMGVLIESTVLRWSVSMEMRGFAAIGVLGAFTTFSTFSLDTVFLYERGKLMLSAVYVATSVIGCIAALFAGLALVRRFLG